MNDTLSIEIVKDIAAGSEGATYSRQGMRVLPVGDVLTLVSENIDPEFAAASVPAFVAKWAPVAARYNLVFGCFHLPSGRYSLDLNVVRARESRIRTMSLARLNRQHSIWDGAAGVAVPTGHSGEEPCRLTTPADVSDALWLLETV